MPGYLPESEPFECETWEEAVAFLVDTIDRWWDEDYAASDDHEEADAAWLPIHSELPLHITGEPFGIAVPTRNLTLWVERSEE